MLQIYQDAKSVRAYDASRFRRMIATYGGLETARRILGMSGITQGLTELYMAKRCDLTVESLVLRQRSRQRSRKELRMPTTTASEVVVLRGGLSVPLPALQLLWCLEDRGLLIRLDEAGGPWWGLEIN